MAEHNKYFTGSGLSRYLIPGERSWETDVFQSGKPGLDSEQILNQEIAQTVRNLLFQKEVPSGWLRGPGHTNPADDFQYPAPTVLPDAFLMRKRTAVVAGRPVVVEYADVTTKGWNVIQLDSAPVNGGAPPDVKRTDFVFLEVWLALVSNSPNASGTCQVLVAPTTGTITIGGVALTPAGGARTPGADDYNNTLGTVGAIAAEIVAAINDPANTFAATVTAQINPTATDTVWIFSNVSGAAGNLISLAESTAGAEFTISGPFLAGGVDEPNKPTQDTLYRHGNVLAPAGVNLPDDIADPVIKAETTKRVQVQYRIRKTGQSEDVNFKTEPDGFSNANVLAQGGQAAPVATYPFVPADSTTISANSDATAYDITDDGLWIAGDGSSASATALGTVDGYVYAIPMMFVFRRNDASGTGGFDPANNTNGALASTHGGFVNTHLQGGTGVAIPANESDRPDGYFHDVIEETDILDLRRQVIPGGLDMQAELRHQMQLLLDNSLGTWAIDGADKQDLGSGSGDVSWRFLVCNEVGRNDTTRGETIGEFDHVRRRFGDQPVVEKLMLELYPGDTPATNPGKYVTQASPGYAGWAEDDEITIDFVNLNASTTGNWNGPTTSADTVFTSAPAGTMITDVRAWHDDGDYNAPLTVRDVLFKTVVGMGTPTLKLTLDDNPQVVTGGIPGPPYLMVDPIGGSDQGSPRRIFVEVEVTYPLGEGATDTPDETLTPDSAWTFGALDEVDVTQRPADAEQLMPVRFREPKREIHLEYVANDIAGWGAGTPITDTIVSDDPLTLYFPRRVFGSAALLTGVTDQVDALPRSIDVSATEYGSSSRLVALNPAGPNGPLSGAGNTLCQVTYFAQDAIPNYGGGIGYQLAAYFRSEAPQTVGTKAGVTSLPDPLTIRPLVMSKDLWTGTVGSGSADIPYPYDVPMDQIACNDNGGGTFTGEWYFAATAQISVDDFNAETGLLNLHAMLPVDGTTEFTFSSADKDAEFRAMYKISDPSAYRPTVFAQAMSNVTRHKVWAPFLATATADDGLWRKGEVLLVVISRFAELDDENTVRFVDTDNRTCAAIYRTRGLLLIAE